MLRCFHKIVQASSLSKNLMISIIQMFLLCASLHHLLAPSSVSLASHSSSFASPLHSPVLSCLLIRISADPSTKKLLHLNSHSVFPRNQPHISPPQSLHDILITHHPLLLLLNVQYDTIPLFTYSYFTTHLHMIQIPSHHQSNTLSYYSTTSPTHFPNIVIRNKPTNASTYPHFHAHFHKFHPLSPL
jgi:hypothetical protein